MKNLKFLKKFDNFINEKSFFNIDKDRNNNLISTITTVLDRDNEDDMIELLKDILPNTEFSGKEYRDGVFKTLKDGEFYPHSDSLPPTKINSSQEIRRILDRIRYYLNKGVDLKDIKIYRPNSGSPYFNISNNNMSFHS